MKLKLEGFFGGKTEFEHFRPHIYPSKQKQYRERGRLPYRPQHAQWILNEIENTFNGTFAGQKSML